MYGHVFGYARKCVVRFQPAAPPTVPDNSLAAFYTVLDFICGLISYPALLNDQSSVVGRYEKTVAVHVLGCNANNLNHVTSVCKYYFKANSAK